MFSGVVKTGLGKGAVEVPFGQFYDTIIDWKFVLASCAIYSVVVYVYNAYTNAKLKGDRSTSVKKDSVFVTAIVVSHNLALTAFSLLVFVSVTPAWFYKFFSNPSIIWTYCDKGGTIWNELLFYWSWLFYLSKYYEFMDTLILMLKGKPITTLQSYHHAGAVISMWLIVYGKAAGSWAFVSFNSLVHTIMYTYFTLTALKIKPPYKKMLTSLQIFQFALGVPVSMSYILIPGCLRRLRGTETKELGAYTFVSLYLVPLIHMFVQFAKRTFFYNSSRSKKA